MSSNAADSSTNALSCSRNTSFSSSTRWCEESLLSSHLTADRIAKECIRNGYYRNPICNDVLYLHHKGITEIDANAFDMYTEVKVLWLEGNGLTSLACGEGFVQVKPPKSKKLFEEDSEKEETEEAVLVPFESITCIGDSFDGHTKVSVTRPSGLLERHADPNTMIAPSRDTKADFYSYEEASKDVENELQKNAQPEMMKTISITMVPCSLPENHTIPSEKKDIFSSLYKKVRQLYLHNNVLREMPDLSRFQRLDSVNLSNNFFPSVRPCCPYWRARMKEHNKGVQEASSNVKEELGLEQKGSGGRTEEEQKDSMADNAKSAPGIMGPAQEDKKTDSSELASDPSGIKRQNLGSSSGEVGERKETVVGAKNGVINVSATDMVLLPRRLEEAGSELDFTKVHDSPSTPTNKNGVGTTSIGRSVINATTTNERIGSCSWASPSSEQLSTLMRTRVISSEAATEKYELFLQRWKSQIELFSTFCPHKPVDDEFCGKEWKEICLAQRCPCSSLRTLNLAGNHLESFEDLCGLLCYKNLCVLDLSQNHIKDGEMLLLILERLPRLRCLKLSGNPLVRVLRRYRKTIIARCKQLLHLDDRPVFEEERRLVNAWAEGGDKGEEAERMAIRDEKAAKERKRLDDFRKLIAQSCRQGVMTSGAEKSSGTGDGSHPHEQYIAAITTREALDSVESIEKGKDSSSSSEDEVSSTSTDEYNNNNNSAERSLERAYHNNALGKPLQNKFPSSILPSFIPSQGTSQSTGKRACNLIDHFAESEDKDDDDEPVYIPS